jgi:hypothetical protein
LALNGEATKKDILLDVFGKHIGDDVTQGWGTYVFGLGVKYGYFRKTQKNNSVYWSIA